MITITLGDTCVCKGRGAQKGKGGRRRGGREKEKVRERELLTVLLCI